MTHFLAGIITGIAIAACAYGLYWLYKHGKDLPPVEGKTIVKRSNGKRHYRTLPKRSVPSPGESGAAETPGNLEARHDM